MLIRALLATMKENIEEENKVRISTKMITAALQDRDLDHTHVKEIGAEVGVTTINPLTTITTTTIRIITITISSTTTDQTTTTTTTTTTEETTEAGTIIT